MTLINDESLDRIIEHIEHGGTPPTLGYAIDEQIFFRIAEAAAKNIHKWGWKNYVLYVDSWSMKILPKE